MAFAPLYEELVRGSSVDAVVAAGRRELINHPFVPVLDDPTDLDAFLDSPETILAIGP